MIKDYLTHDELQHIEHANKILREHEDLVLKTIAGVQPAIEDYVQVMKQLVKELIGTQLELMRVNSELVKSIREMKLAVSNVNEIINYSKAITELEKVLDSGIVDKVVKLRE